jgi:hypothetical protein
MDAGWTRSRTIFALAALACLVAAPSAGATVRYVNPTGVASGSCETASPGCTLNWAVENVAQTGDEIVVLPGTHTLPTGAGGQVTVGTGVQLNIHGQDGQPRPRIVRAAGPSALGGIDMTYALPGSVLRHLEIEAPASAVITGELQGTALLEDLVLTAVDCGFCGGGGAVILRKGWTLRDSSARMLQMGGAGVLATRGASKLVNVTVFAPPPAHTGLMLIDAGAPDCGIAIPVSVSAVNVIARGGTDDIRVTNNCGAGTATILTVGYSNYRAAETTVTGAGSIDTSPGGNQTAAAPLLENESLGNFHQLAGSPTIDAGTTDPDLGTVDLDGGPRLQGCKPDIGVDEFPSGPCPDGGGGGGGGGADTTDPQASALRLDPARFRAAARGSSIAARTGATVSYRLSEPASVLFRVERRAAGRRVGKRCVKPNRSNRRRKRCTRWLRQRGSFTHSGQAGANSFRFTGRLRGRKLRPGRYRLVGLPTDLAGNSGAAIRATFRIVRR